MEIPLDHRVLVDDGPLWVGVWLERQDRPYQVKLSPLEMAAMERGECGLATAHVAVREGNADGYQICAPRKQDLWYGNVPGHSDPLDPLEHERLPEWVAKSMGFVRKNLSEREETMNCVYHRSDIPGVMERVREAQLYLRHLIEAAIRIQEQYEER